MTDVSCPTLPALRSCSSAELLPQIYAELRRLAAAKMARESAAHTLQPTALVHDMWIRLGDGHAPKWQNRAHFFAAAAETMRRILIDRARQRQAVRHGGDQQRVNIDDVDVASHAGHDDQVVAVHEALAKFAAEDPRKAELVKLRYFGGLTLEEAAAALDLPLGTAKRWWTYARAWFFREISN